MTQGTASMKIKSYFASSVEQAIQQAREELGAEAMLITSRRASPDARQFGAYEVVFGMPSQNMARTASPETRDLNSELQALRTQLDDIKRTLRLNNSSRPEVTSTPAEFEDLLAELLAADLSPDLSRQIVDEAFAAWQDAPPATRSLTGSDLPRGLVADCIRKKLQFAPSFRRIEQDAHRIVVFAGPPGAGKSATLAKIAVRECLAQRMSLRIISVDPHGVAPHEKLRALAGILGAGFTAASTIQEFVQAVDEFRSKNFLLVDTPGCSARDMDNSRDLCGVLAGISQKETHLVLPASMKRTDLVRCIRRFEPFHPDYLLFTKLDETESFGGILSAAIETGKLISFFAAGQGIPEDLDSANAEVLLNFLLAGNQASAVSAA